MITLASKESVEGGVWELDWMEGWSWSLVAGVELNNNGEATKMKLLEQKLEFCHKFLKEHQATSVERAEKIWGAHQQNIGTQLIFVFVLESG